MINSLFNSKSQGQWIAASTAALIFFVFLRAEPAHAWRFKVTGRSQQTDSLGISNFDVDFNIDVDEPTELLDLDIGSSYSSEEVTLDLDVSFSTDEVTDDSGAIIEFIDFANVFEEIFESDLEVKGASTSSDGGFSPREYEVNFTGRISDDYARLALPNESNSNLLGSGSITIGFSEPANTIDASTVTGGDELSVELSFSEDGGKFFNSGTVDFVDFVETSNPPRPKKPGPKPPEFDPEPVPEPASVSALLLMGLGLLSQRKLKQSPFLSKK